MTQAQIDAAAEAIRKYMGVFTDAEVIAKAALTAAAEECECKYARHPKAIADLKSEVERLKATAAEMPAPHFWSGAEEVRLRTIERCAEEAANQQFSSQKYNANPYEECAAAIRAMKDKP